MKSYHSYIIDLEGVLVRGAEVIPGARRFIKKLNKLKKGYVIVSNLSTFTVDDISLRLNELGFSIDKSNILTSSLMASKYIKSSEEKSSVFIYEKGSLFKELKYNGLNVTTEVSTNNKFVVLGYHKSINSKNIDKIVKQLSYGSEFVATSKVMKKLSNIGEIPGPGHYVNLVEKLSGITATVVGKPSKIIFEEALDRLSVPKSKILVIGDSIDEDIIGADGMNLDSALVYTGIKKIKKAGTYQFSSIADI